MSRRAKLLLRVGFVLVAGGVAAGIALAFHGGGSSLTPAQYLARADAACRSYGRQLDRIAPPDPGSTSDVAASVGRALPILQKQADAVRKIRPPRELEQRVRRFFELSDRAVAELGAVLDAAKRNDAEAMGPRLGAWFKASDDSRAASKRVGFRC
jgi:hypothetical protein